MANTRPPDLATCEMLRKLMKSARDDHLTDPQIQFLSGTVTSANLEHNIKLLHKANKEKANKDKADKEKANKDEAQPRNPRPTVAQHGSAIKRQEHSLLYKHTLPVPSEAGAVICADTFERLNTEDIRALHKLINVCPFNLASQTCVHAKDCYLVRICSVSVQIHSMSPSSDPVSTRMTVAHSVVGAGAHTTSKVPANRSWKASNATMKLSTGPSARKTTITKLASS
ncbi:hypothetical protein D6D26_05722 [Aureobasidium pullulans]|nr:hypothetical protein D6D26_05722 [Aureobasidium pullulans]